MKTYTWREGNITKGLDVVNDERLGPVVVIGEGGRGRRYEKIKLDRAHPAKVIDGKVFDADLHTMPLPPRANRPKQDFFALKKPMGPSKSVIVRVCTQWAPAPGSYGTWSISQGNPREKISGRGARGEAGRAGQWIESLITMGPGDVLQIRPEGGHNAQPWALWLDNGVPQTAPWSEYKAPAETPTKPKSQPGPITEPNAGAVPNEWDSDEAASSALDALRTKFAN